MTSRICACLLALAVLLAVPATARAEYPEKPIEIIVPNPPGGGTDLAARIVAKALQAKWKVPVRVVNMPGGAQFVAVEYVHRANPDGYTVFADGLSGSSLLANIVRDMPFKVSDRTFFAYAVRLPMVLVVPADSPFKTLDDVIAGIKKAPSTITWGALGGTGVSDLAMLKLFRTAGVNPKETRAVVSKGGAEIAVQVAGGHIMLGVGSPATFKSFVDGGQVRVITTFAEQRSPALPAAPSTVEAKHPELVTVQWNGFSGPPKVPEEIAKKWHAALQDLFKDPVVSEELSRIGLDPYPSKYGTMQADVEEETKVIGELLKQ